MERPHTDGSKNCPTAGRHFRKVAGVLLCSPVPIVLAAECTPETMLSYRGLLTYGNAWRVEDRSADFVFAANALAAHGEQGRSPGKNTDDGNLNFSSGDRVYSVIKGLGVVDMRCNSLSGRLSAYAWSDQVAEGKGMPWGHIPNGYMAGNELSDAGAPRRAEYSGYALQEAWLQIGTQPDQWLRVGRQTIPWGPPASRLGGGVEQINAEDIQLKALPGVNERSDRSYSRNVDVDPLKEGSVPAASLLARHSFDSTVVEGIYFLDFEPNVIPGCGRFDSYADYVAPGCNRVYVGNGSDRESAQQGLFATRAPDVRPDRHGQYGVRLQYTREGVGRFNLYAANFHSRRYIVGAVKSGRAGPPLIPGDPDGRNVRYFLEYPEDIRLYAASWAGEFDEKRGVFSLEYTVQPNQALRLNNTDLLNAFGSTLAPTPLRAEADAVAAGATFSGYDSYRVSQLRLSIGHDGRGVLGATGMSLQGEIGLKFVHSLPDPAQRRYGRSDAFGLGPVGGVCAGTSVQCSTNGYVSSRAWGYRVKLELDYANVVPDVRLMPSIALLHDVKGWSWDDAINEGRKAATFALRIEGKSSGWFGDLAWTTIWGGDYNVSKDRDVARLTVGLRYD
jgi:hypothetical protein